MNRTTKSILFKSVFISIGLCKFIAYSMEICLKNVHLFEFVAQKKSTIYELEVVGVVVTVLVGAEVFSGVLCGGVAWCGGALGVVGWPGDATAIDVTGGPC